ncbi:hypothetical protein [Paramicrobacterium agarici]|uniref:hypothetical protein n=1 Tax=Paramicrobacterium agarici TaxID=630514 RepID=UPI001151FA05|nr:hypothetical protein [Microbacterium agarici]TQO24254.1 hypothetical protein FB385_3134 [Microbacterium agarici]
MTKSIPRHAAPKRGIPRGRIVAASLSALALAAGGIGLGVMPASAADDASWVYGAQLYSPDVVKSFDGEYWTEGALPEAYSYLEPEVAGASWTQGTCPILGLPGAAVDVQKQFKADGWIVPKAPAAVGELKDDAGSISNIEDVAGFNEAPGGLAALTVAEAGGATSFEVNFGEICGPDFTAETVILGADTSTGVLKLDGQGASRLHYGEDGEIVLVGEEGATAEVTAPGVVRITIAKPVAEGEQVNAVARTLVRLADGTAVPMQASLSVTDPQGPQAPDEPIIEDPAPQPEPAPVTPPKREVQAPPVVSG